MDDTLKVLVKNLVLVGEIKKCKIKRQANDEPKKIL